MSSRRLYRILVPLAALLIAGAFLVSGGVFATYKVYEEPLGDPGDPFSFFEKISEPEMVREATYGGVALDAKGYFYFTYDRTEALTGAKPCPT